MHIPGFEVGEKIDCGGGASWCRARRTSDGRRVLLRMPAGGVRSSASARTLLERELEICRDLEVGGVLKALDLIEGADGAVLVLADAPGEPLDQILGRRTAPLPIAAALTIGSRLATTLSALHQRDLVHRDLRPANVVCDEASDRVSLTGLGRASRVQREAWKIRAPNRLEGDPVYLAPEATGRLDRQLDYRADLYSLGVVLFEMLTGRPPFDDTEPAVLVHAHIALEPPDPRELRQDLPAAVSAIVGKLLAKAAEDRYQSGLGLRHDLERCLADLEDGSDAYLQADARPFVPGERDTAERFELPQGLFGREEELRWLEEALAATAAGSVLVRFVAGYSGVGKTSLVEEIRFSVLGRQGLFASGTFDPSSNATPYDGILIALRGLVVQKLDTEPELVEVWARRLEAELGANLGVMTETLPELSSLVGEPPPVPGVPPENAKNRFYACVEKFLATLAGGRAPLVVFLDDLQWADASSLELLESLLAGDAGAFLLLGAYRDNEVGEDHPLLRTVAELDLRGVDVDTLRLSPLGEPALTRLVAETMQLPISEVASLAELVYRKTAGNPFFARTFLSTLYRRELLYFTVGPSPSGDLPRWAWDLEAIAALEATESVIELVASRLTELSADARQTVVVASVLGKEVDLETLTALCGPEARGFLIEACRQGLLVNLGVPSREDRREETSRFAFVHDRVREGANQLLDEDERAGLHLRIGRLLRDRAGLRQAGPRQAGAGRNVFEIVDHLNRAPLPFTDPAERRDLVRLNAEAGRQAKASGAFPVAYTYLRRVLEHLGVGQAAADPWREDYALTRALYAEAAEAASFAREFAAAEQLSGVLIANAHRLLDAVPAYETLIHTHYSRHEEEEALRIGLDILGRLGIEIPSEPTASDFQAALLKADRAVETVLAEVAKRGVEELPEMRDPEHLATAGLLVRGVLIAGWPRERLMRLTACRLVELTAAHGVGPASPLAYVFMADVRYEVLKDPEGGRRAGELGLRLIDYPPASGLAPIVRQFFDLLIGGRTLHPATLPERFAEHFRQALAFGDLLVASGSGYQSALVALIGGSELAKTEASALEYQARARGFGQLKFARATEGVAKLAAVLRGRGTIEEAVDTADVPPEAVTNVRIRLIGAEMMVRCVLRGRDAALEVARESLAMPNGILPMVPVDFYRCLAFLDSDPDEPELAACKARLQAQAEATPELHGHRWDLVTAHDHRSAGRVDEALALYEKAAVGARRNNFPHEEALARELAGELCVELGRHRAAAACLREAFSAYRRWGARAKLDQLHEWYPDLLEASADPSSLDAASLKRAENLLQTELDLAKLLRRLVALLLQNAAARRGFLLRSERLRGARPRNSRERIVIEASGSVDGKVRVSEEKTLDAEPEIAATIVRFVARTQETVTLGEATRDSRFASDPYIERRRPRSVLCFPLLHGGELAAIVYLENDRSPDVFSPERSGAVRLLASQAAAALENARLHHSLKQEVETRRRAEAELAALKDRLEAEKVYLQEEIQSHFEEIVGNSDAIRRVLYKVEQVAATDATVLILGETGTGKELFARALHRLSPRRERPLVKVNCAALPATLIESELFGHEKGAFTGALCRKAGRFELADSGTLFLDEIGDLPLDLQAKLLRVLQEGEFERLGGLTLKVDVRIIAATNRDLEQAMTEGTFRSDLYYRLTVFPIELPPLRERGDDLQLLVRYFVGRKRGKLGSRVEKIPQKVMERLAAYDWPGNVRELENVVERALILSPDDTLRLDESFGAARTAPGGSERFVDVERAHIHGVLEASGWKIKGQGNAADRLGFTPQKVRYRMKKLGIVRPES